MVAAQAALATAVAEPPPPADDGANTPLDDPYLPDPGDPDIFEPEDGPGEESSPLNPADD